MKSRMFVALLLCCAGSAAAETAVVPPPPVETMTCPQMQAEMTVAGQAMGQNMDPNLAANIEQMQGDAESNMAEAGVGALGAGAICAVPGMGIACTAAMTAFAARQEAQAAKTREKTDAVEASMNQATAGLDIERLTAIASRWESEECKAPE